MNKKPKELEPGEEAIKEFHRLTVDIYECLRTPLPIVSDPNAGMRNYTDEHGKVHLSKMFRNMLASQRLFSVLDRIKDMVFSLEYLNGRFELDNPKAGRKFLESYVVRSLVALDIQIVNGMINFLSHFFDLHTRDKRIDRLEFLNLLWLKDHTLCLEIEQLLQSPELRTLDTIWQETQVDYWGLTRISDFGYRDGKSTIRLEAATYFSLEDVKRKSVELIRMLHAFLKFLADRLRIHYKQSLGYDSPLDFVAKADSDSGFLIGSFLDSIERAKLQVPIKIFNLVGGVPDKIETEVFAIEQNRTFAQVKEKFYRATTEKRTTLEWHKDSPPTVTTNVYEPQEGALFWTHTLILKETTPRKSKLIVGGEFSDDLCLLLSFFSGRGVYTEQTSLRYSHKAEVHKRLHSFEFNNAIISALNKIDNSSEREQNVLGMALSKYREAMQPMSSNNRLVRFWEIIDIIAYFYCQDRMKKIPNGYNRDSLREKLVNELDQLEERIGIPLRNGFTPIFLNKSIMQKIMEMTVALCIPQLLKVQEDQLRQAVKKAYDFRSKLTHSAGVDFSNAKEREKLFAYYFFVSDLLFLIHLRLLNTKPKLTLQDIKTDLMGFIRDERHYGKRSKQLEHKAKEFDELVKYLSGEKPLPKGKTKFNI